MKVVILLSMVQLTFAGQLCLKCDNVVSPSECASVTICSDREFCSVTKYITSFGSVLYNLGCQSSDKCINNVGKKEVFTDGRFVICIECCNSTKACNIGGLCQTKSLDYHGGHLCFHCDQALSPNSCSSIRLCGQDQVCYVGEKVSHITGKRLWEAKCALARTQCPFGVIGSSSVTPIFGRRGARSGVLCSQCCVAHFCNNECNIPTLLPTLFTKTTTTPILTTATKTTTTTTTTTPTTTTDNRFPPKVTNVGGINSVQIGVDVRLFCSAIGKPSPSVWWNVLQQNPNVNNFHIEGNGHILVIENYSRANDGTYMCVATNSLGKDEKIFTLHA